MAISGDSHFALNKHKDVCGNAKTVHTVPGIEEELIGMLYKFSKKIQRTRILPNPLKKNSVAARPKSKASQGGACQHSLRTQMQKLHNVNISGRN